MIAKSIKNLNQFHSYLNKNKIFGAFIREDEDSYFAEMDKKPDLNLFTQIQKSDSGWIARLSKKDIEL